MSGTTPPRPGTARERLGTPLIAFIVFDVLLVLAAVWLAVSLVTGSDDEPSAEPGATSTSTTAGGDATADPEPTQSEPPAEEPAAEQVVSPSGNIACEVTAEGARCAISELAAEPAPVEGCDGTVGYVAEVTADGVDVPCVTGDEPLPVGNGAQVLEYGQETAVEGFVCASTEAGMTCTDAGTGRGFTLARAGITTIG